MWKVTIRYYPRHFSVRRSVCVLALVVLLGALNLIGAKAETFDGCGTLIPGYICQILFGADSGGVYYLGYSGGFKIGDYVRVVGTVVCCVPSPCYVATEGIINNTISWCNVPVDYTTWGRVKALYTIPPDYSRRGME